MYLVTGGAGFIGSHLVEALVKRGERVRVLDDLSSGTRENLAPVADAIELSVGDVADLETARRAARGARYVLHHAALASVHVSVQDPLRAHRVNTLGTLNMLLAAREAGVERVVLASSAAVYGAAQALPLKEETPPQPLSPYAATKLAGEGYLRGFLGSFGLEGVSLRYFNVYGPRQDPTSPYSGVISKFADALAGGEPPTIYGDGGQTRDFVYVADVVRANLLACTVPSAVGQTLNVAGGRRTSILELAGMMSGLMGGREPPRFGPARPGEVRDSEADVTRAEAVLGWQAETTLEEGLARTVAWFAGA
jgi:nucleoside-diphosphate-sugar epimerase